METEFVQHTPMSQARPASSQPRSIAVLIPCHNEELTIGDVVREFRKVLPEAAICVFDNNSRDETVREAAAAGAEVFHEPRQGKGYVVQSMFRRIDADIYVMIDGDSTYPVDAVHSLIAPVASGEADMVIGSRLHASSQSEFKALNRLGNLFYLRILNKAYGADLTDLLSGYRAFSRRLVKGVPLFGGGFETEAELTIKALQRGYRTIEVPVNLTPRPVGSSSKIRIVRDGFIILSTMLTLIRDYKPLTFFGGIGMVLSVVPLILLFAAAMSPDVSFRANSQIALVGLTIAGLISISVGLILHTIARHFQEMDSQIQRLSEEVSRSGNRDAG